jgi:hypothetical protein
MKDLFSCSPFSFVGFNTVVHLVDNTAQDIGLKHLDSEPLGKNFPRGHTVDEANFQTLQTG